MSEEVIAEVKGEGEQTETGLETVLKTDGTVSLTPPLPTETVSTTDADAAEEVEKKQAAEAAVPTLETGVAGLPALASEAVPVPVPAPAAVPAPAPAPVLTSDEILKSPYFIDNGNNVFTFKHGLYTYETTVKGQGGGKSRRKKSKKSKKTARRNSNNKKKSRTRR